MKEEKDNCNLEWGIDTYVVFVRKLNISTKKNKVIFNVGDIAQIKKELFGEYKTMFKVSINNKIYKVHKWYCMWFETKEKAEKFSKKILEGIKVNFKIGDWVIGWDNNDAQYNNTAWQIGKINYCEQQDMQFVSPLNTDNFTFIFSIRYATIDEIRKSNVRKPGFYWTKILSEWIISRWNGLMWQLYDSTYITNDSFFKDIDENIIIKN